MKSAAALLLSALLVTPAMAKPASGPAEQAPARHAVHLDTFLSHDADDTNLIRTGLSFDLSHYGPDDYRGIRIEKAWFDPVGAGWQSRERAYLRLADQIGAWKAKVQVGTDGDTVLGSASIHDEAAVRKEFFVERDVVETRRGLSEGIYYTFAGAAVDIPADERNSVTLLGGVQAFTGDNVRVHLRANYVHVVDPDQGVSVQLRTRYFSDSEPREFDYYSPRWYAQVLPVLQLRRYSGGWRYLLAGGIGAQKEAQGEWRRSGYFNAQIESPQRGDWRFNAAFLFSETPTTSGQSYSYGQATIGLSRLF